MKKILIILLINTVCASEMESLTFLKNQADIQKKEFRYNQYEDIITGGLGFLVGNIGYHETDSASLKLAYSGIQTIGILNVGQGVYDYYRPLFDKEIYQALTRRKNTASEIVRIFAQEERAKRLSLLYKSSLLSAQYFANAYLGNTEENLKDIYKFLGGVNLIVVGYALFYQDKYEKFYYSNSISPVAINTPLGISPGLAYQVSF